MSDLQFYLDLDDDDEQFELTGNVTVGRHLDNDLVIAGEDVRDFHARLDVTNRGPMVWPLDGAPLMIDERAVETTMGLMPGDCLVIGHHTLTVVTEADEQTVQWALYPAADDQPQSVAGTVLVGRSDSSDLQILEGHVSRRHAELVVLGDSVWLKDLGSSNGSYINGERVIGASRIYHGDELTFDISRFQLIGDHPDLTPIRSFTANADAFEIAPELSDDSIPTAEVHPLRRAESASSPTPADVDGPALRGIEGNIADRTFALQFGRQLLGRAPDVDIHLPEPSVSLRHAEIDVRSDGVIVTNLISTNGVKINGSDVHIQRLEPGDQLQLGRAVLEFIQPEPVALEAPAGTTGRTLVIAVGVAVLAGILLWWGFS